MAQVKVEVLNNKSSKVYASKFKTQEEANNWIEDNRSNNSWGKPDRWLDQTDGTHTQTREVIIQEATPEMEVEVDVTDESGEPTGEKQKVTIPASEEISKTQYFFPQEFSVTTTDISSEIAAKEAEELALKKEKDDVKKLIKNVEESDKPDWEKKILKKLIKDL
jgi:hypothetical protein